MKFEQVIQSINKNEAKKAINLSEKMIGNQKAIQLVKLLASNTSVEKLYLTMNQLDDVAAFEIANTLAVNKSIEVLYLDKNKIGDLGGVAIFEALEKNSTIQRLYFSDNLMADRSALALAKLLKTNKTITLIQLMGNKIGDFGASAILQSLHENRAVTEFLLGGNKISDGLLETIRQVLGGRANYSTPARLPLKNGAITNDSHTPRHDRTKENHSNLLSETHEHLRPRSISSPQPIEKRSQLNIAVGVDTRPKEYESIPTTPTEKAQQLRHLNLSRPAPPSRRPPSRQSTKQTLFSENEENKTVVVENKPKNESNFETQKSSQSETNNQIPADGTEKIINQPIFQEEKKQNENFSPPTPLSSKQQTTLTQQTPMPKTPITQQPQKITTEIESQTQTSTNFSEISKTKSQDLSKASGPGWMTTIFLMALSSSTTFALTFYFLRKKH